MIPQVVASERGLAQQCCYGNIGVVGPRYRKKFSEKNSLENETIDGDSPVFEAKRSVVVS